MREWNFPYLSMTKSNYITFSYAEQKDAVNLKVLI